MRILQASALACVALCGLRGQTLAAQSEAAAADTSTAGPSLPARAGLGAYPSGRSTPLGTRIQALLRTPAVAGAHWGIAVTAMDGTPLYGLDEAKLFRPASTAKLFTTAVAVALLHPDATFATGVYGKLDSAGVVNGDIVLFGNADGEFGSHDLPYRQPSQDPSSSAQEPAHRPLADLDELADQLVAHGVHRITGEVIGDDGLRPFLPYAEGWSDEDKPWGYGAPVSALTIANNELPLTITPGHPTGDLSQAASAPTVTLDQYGVPYYTLDSEVFTSDLRIGNKTVKVEQFPDSRNLRISGVLKAGGSADVEHIAIADPAAFAATALRHVLIAHGIQVDGSAKSHHRLTVGEESFQQTVLAPGDCEALIVNGNGGCPAGCTTYAAGSSPLAEHRSAPLIQDIVFTMKTSQNLHAELLLTHLSELDLCSKGSAAEGVRILRAFLLHAGLHDGDFTFYDGSGLSTKDLVTPRAEAQLLAYATKQPWFAQWKAALPIGGVDGTLSTRFTQPPLKGHVFAKTGTLGESRALAGYVQCRSGREVIFAILDDDHLPGSSADRAVMDSIVEAIAAAN